MSSPTPTLPKGSLILVTGATGFVASHTVQQLLQQGYDVRGTVRSLSQAKWLTEDTIAPKTSYSGSLELIEVQDLAAPNAFDEAVKGVAGIMHIATPGTFDPNPHNVVPQTVAGVTEIMTAAAREPSVKEFVFTSSIVASMLPRLGDYTHVDADTWNDGIMDIAYAPPPYTPDRGIIAYIASKVAAERELWKVAKEKNVKFNVNAILPAGVMGKPLHKKHTEGPATWLTFMWNGERAKLEPFPASYFVSVRDVAALHIATLLDPDTRSQRIQIWGHSANWNDMLLVLRDRYPEREFMPYFTGEARAHMSATTDQRPAVALLKKWTKDEQDGFASVESIVIDTVDNQYYV